MTTTRTASAASIPAYLRPSPDKVLRVPPWGWTLGILLVGAAVVEVLGRVGVASRATLIPFSEMLFSAARLLVTGSFWTDAFLPSFLAIVGAFVIAAIFGVVLGYIIWRVGPVRTALDPYLAAYYALPIFALYPVFIALWGQGRWPIIGLGALFAVVAVIMSAMNGFDSAPPILHKLARSLDVSEWTYFVRFFLPSAMPHVLTGLRLAFLYSLLTVIAAEFLLSNAGLGFFIQNAYIRFNVADMYGGIVVVFLFSLLSDWVITRLVRRLTWVGALP